MLLLLLYFLYCFLSFLNYFSLLINFYFINRILLNTFWILRQPKCFISVINKSLISPSLIGTGFSTHSHN